MFNIGKNNGRGTIEWTDADDCQIKLQAEFSAYSKKTNEKMAFTTSGIGIGAVLAIQDSGTSNFVQCKKQEKLNYEFGNTWVFPGGMARLLGHECDDYEIAIRDSLKCRVFDETGLTVNPELFRVCGWPIPTRYHAKGKTRTTLVLPFMHTETVSSTSLWSKASSIAGCELRDLGHEAIRFMAPANAIIANNLARILNPMLPKNQEAVFAEFCETTQQIATEVGLGKITVL